MKRSGYLARVSQPFKNACLFKKLNIKRSISKVSNVMKVGKKHIWNKPEFWLSVAIIVIMIVIGYGIWLSFYTWNKLTP